MLAIKAAAARGYKALETAIRALFRDRDIVVYQGSGAAAVIGIKSLNTVFKIARDRNSDFMDVELTAINEASFAHDLGYVYASVVSINAQMIARIPPHVKTNCQVGDKIVTMPMLQGTTALQAINELRVGPQIIARAIVDHVAKLRGHKWYNTDMKLENIQVTPEGRVVFLDWGSLCDHTCLRPTATWVVDNYATNARVCGSVTAVIAIAEAFGISPPEEQVVATEKYIHLRDDVLELLEPPHVERFATATVNDRFFVESSQRSKNVRE